MSKSSASTRFRAKIFNALADPIRLEIIDFLRDEEKCVCEITPHLNLVPYNKERFGDLPELVIKKVSHPASSIP